MAKSVAERLSQLGIESSRSTITLLDPEALTVVKDKKHVLYDPRVDLPLDPEMLQSLEDHGVLQPIRVRENGERDGRPVLEVIFGRRRTRHLIEVNHRRVARGLPKMKMPVIFVHGSDQEMLLLMLSENFQRKDDTPMSAAWKIKTAIKLGASPRMVAEAIGSSEGRVKNLLDLLNLVPAAQNAIESGALPLGAVSSFSSLPREEQEAAVKLALETGATKRHEVEEVVQSKKNGTTYRPAKRKRAWGRRELTLFAERLKDEAGADARKFQTFTDFLLGKGDAQELPLTIVAAVEDVCKQLGKKIRGAKRKAT